MFEPLSTAVGICWLGYAGLNAYARPSSAISPEAKAVAKAVSVLVEAGERSQVLFGKKAMALSKLIALANECASTGWDGDSASPIDPMAVLHAAEFVRALPDGMPLPDFAPEPDGGISLDWIHSRHRLFALSVGNTDRLAYAWLDGTDKGHGVARFDGSKVPLRVLEQIRTTMSDGNAFVRAA